MSDTATLEAVAKAVHDLSDAVIDMKSGMVSEETVARIAQDVLERQREAAAALNEKRGVTPEDVDQHSPRSFTARFKGAALLEEVLDRQPDKVAYLLGRPEADVRHFQEASDSLVLLAAMKGVDPRETSYYADEFVPAMRAAMDTATSAEGQEWVPKNLSSDLIRRVNLDLQVVALFPSIQMPTQPFDIPGMAVSRQRGGYAAEQTADSGQTKFKVLTAGTRKITLTAKKFAARMLTSKELEEDSFLAILPFMQSEIVDFLTADMEDAVINGDTTGTHQDSDTTASDDPRKYWDGLRVQAQSGAKTDASNAALTLAMLRTNRLKMGKYGTRPSNLAHIVGMQNYIHLLSDANFITMDKYGVNATVLSGELGKADGSPVIVSEYVRADLNASGVYDGSTTNRSVALSVYTPGYMTGIRRGLTVETLRELYAESDQDLVLASHRRAFAERYTRATELCVAAHYNTKTT